MTGETPRLDQAVTSGFDDIATYVATMSPSEALHWVGALAVGFGHACEFHHEIGEHLLRASGALQMRIIQQLLVHVVDHPNGIARLSTLPDTGFAVLLERIVSEINQAKAAERDQ